MPKTKKPLHMTEFPTFLLAQLFTRLKKDGVPQQLIANILCVNTQKISAICRHAKK